MHEGKQMSGSASLCGLPRDLPKNQTIRDPKHSLCTPVPLIMGPEYPGEPTKVLKRDLHTGSFRMNRATSLRSVGFALGARILRRNIMGIQHATQEQAQLMANSKCEDETMYCASRVGASWESSGQLGGLVSIRKDEDVRAIELE